MNARALFLMLVVAVALLSHKTRAASIATSA